MTDQIPADKVREIIARHRDGASHRGGMILNDLKALLPLPTLADMTDEERKECQWMQADTKLWGRVVIVLHNAGGGRAMTLDRRGHVAYEDHDTITPRPDLPRLEWPGDEKPAPAPALPDGWRLADHKDNGRVIVTTQTPNAAGNVYFVIPDGGDRRGHRWRYCPPTDLTYTDQEADTPTASGVPAVGTVIESADDPRIAALPDGSILIDRDDDAVVKWGGDWSGAGYIPNEPQGDEFGPWKVLHIREATQ